MQKIPSTKINKVSLTEAPNDLLLFLQKVETSGSMGSFIKATISKPSAGADWKNIFLRPVRIKNKELIQWVFRYPTQDKTENHSLQESIDLLSSLLNSRQCREVHFFDNAFSLILKINKKGKVQIIEKKPEGGIKAPAVEHNLTKKYLISEEAAFLTELGISSSNGKIKAEGRQKFRQINKYVEILSPLLDKMLPGRQSIKILDMGSGLGYLTFALYVHLTEKFGGSLSVTGIELREELTNRCNTIARKLNYAGLEFRPGDISQLTDTDADVLIALHACDVATDLAIGAGIRANCQLIVLAPCCQKQVRRDWTIPDRLKPVLKHGILAERQSEMLTDALRALYLEASGYKTRVFEFISREHTSKNIMITAEKIKGENAKHREKALAEITKIKRQFGLEKHYLEEVLSIK